MYLTFYFVPNFISQSRLEVYDLCFVDRVLFYLMKIYYEKGFLCLNFNNLLPILLYSSKYIEI